MAGDGVVDAIARTWRDPRAAMRVKLDRGLSEAGALIELMLACGLLFVASLPNALRAAAAIAGETSDPVAAAVAAHAIGWIAFAPLLAYALAAAVHLVARGFGARGGVFLPARAALFWSMLAAAPLAIAVALVGALAEAARLPDILPVATVLGYGAMAAWLWVFAASLAEAEGFAGTGRVAAVVLVLVAGALGLATLLTGGAGATR